MGRLQLPLPAFSQDIERLVRQQLDTAIEVLEQKRRSLTLDYPFKPSLVGLTKSL